jgi:hypothetical protein
MKILWYVVQKQWHGLQLNGSQGSPKTTASTTNAQKSRADREKTYSECQKSSCRCEWERRSWEKYNSSYVFSLPSFFLKTGIPLQSFIIIMRSRPLCSTSCLSIRIHGRKIHELKSSLSELGVCSSDAPKPIYKVASTCWRAGS